MAFAATTVGAQAGPGLRAAHGTIRRRQRATLDRFIRHEMADKKLPALSIALVDGQNIVWARGFGIANPEDSTPATARTVYRVGSVSKLFTDIGVMQLVERGTSTSTRRSVGTFTTFARVVPVPPPSRSDSSCRTARDSSASRRLATTSTIRRLRSRRPSAA